MHDTICRARVRVYPLLKMPKGVLADCGCMLNVFMSAGAGPRPLDPDKSRTWLRVKSASLGSEGHNWGLA